MLMRLGHLAAKRVTGRIILWQCICRLQRPDYDLGAVILGPETRGSPSWGQVPNRRQPFCTDPNNPFTRGIAIL